MCVCVFEGKYAYFWDWKGMITLILQDTGDTELFCSVTPNLLSHQSLPQILVGHSAGAMASWWVQRNKAPQGKLLSGLLEGK